MKIVSIKVGVMSCVMLISISGLAQSQSTVPTSGSITAALALEDPSERIAALQKFLKANSIPEQSQTAREAIVASYAQLAEAQLAENNIERAGAGFRKAIAALPENVTDRFFVDTVIRIPQVVSLRGYRNESIDLARQLEKRFAREPLRLAGLGEFYMTIEASVDAIRSLESAVRLGGEDARLHRLLGAAYRVGLRLDDAVAEIQQTIKIDPNDNRAYYELANLYRAHGAYTDATRLYKKQLEIDPKHSSSYKGLALAYLAQGDDEQTSAALDQARNLRGAPEEVAQDIYLHTQMSFYYLLQGKLKQARLSADTAVALEPRYAWARIAAAEVDMAESKYFDAERNLLAVQQYANFPTLFFTLGKLYLAVEDFDGALEQFAKAFSYSPQKQFTARLGAVLEVQGDSVKELLSREHQAAIFIADPPTTQEQFKIVESLVRFNFQLRAIKSATPSRTARREPKVDPDVRRRQLIELDQAATDFIEAERTRRSFRALHISQQLAQAGVATGTAVEWADQALSMAEVATEFEGSLRDYPNYDREGRLRIFRGRALDAKGWALFKSGQNQEAISALSDAVRAYGPLPEAKRALWHLAMAKETAGDLREALDLYIAGYEKPSTGSNLDINRTVIEGLYRKVNGSLNGLDEQLKRAADSSGAGLSAILASLQLVDKSAATVQPKNTESSAVRSSEKKETQLKLPLPTSPFSRDTRSSSVMPSQTKKSSTDQKLTVPLNDPIFARKSPVNQSTDSTNEVTTTTPAAPKPSPVVLTPIVLPSINSDDIRLMLVIKPGKLSARRGNLKIYIEDGPRPAPPVLHTRKRRVTLTAQAPPQAFTRKRSVTSVTQTQPQAHTRKRRVTVSDRQTVR